MNTTKSPITSRARMARRASSVLLPAALGILLLAAGRVQAQPTIPGPTPTPPSGHVVSIYNSSTVYTDIAVLGGYFNDWYNPGGGGAGFYDVSGGNNTNVLYYPAPIIIWGIDFSANPVNVSGCTNLHVDVWSPTATTYDIRLVNTVGGSQQADATGVIVTGGWNSLDIPLSVFTTANPAMALTGIGQVGIVGDGSANSTYYIDNLYFQAGTNLVNTAPPPPPAPTNNAPTPVLDASTVLALYNSSGVYPIANYVDWPAPWSGSPQMPFTITNVTPNSTVEYLPGLSYVGEDYYAPYQIDTTPYNTMHIDLWTGNGNQFYIQLVSLNPTTPAQVGVFNMATNQWVGIDIPLSQFAAANPGTVMSDIEQILWVDNTGTGLQGASFYFDNVYFYTSQVVPPAVPQPTNNAPIPTQPAVDVVSMYNSSSTYADVPVNDWLASWSSANLFNYTITNTGNVVLQYTALNYAGVEFYNPNQIDASALNTLHVDVWTPNANQFGIQLVSLDNGGTQAAQVNFTPASGTITSNHWISLNIPLSAFTNANNALDLTDLQQLLWIDNQGGGVTAGTFYIDNVYFYYVPPVTNVVAASILAGTSLGWTATSANSYQPQQSSNNSAWLNVGLPLSGNTVTTQFALGTAPYYRVLELTPGGANAVPNPGFEIAAVPANAIGATNWNIAVNPNTGANMYVTSQFGSIQPYSGSKMLLIQSTTAASGPVAPPNTDVRSDLFPVTAGTTYNFSFFAANPAKVGGANPQYSFFFYNGTGGAVGGPTFASFASVGANWTQVTGTFTVPAGASQMTIGWIQAAGAGNGENWVSLIDNVVVTSGAISGPTNILSATTQPAVQISWPTGTGTNYQAQSSAILKPAPVWSALGSPVSGNGSVNSITDSRTAAKKFYRVLGIH